jgi:hypothetical protein
MFPQKKRFSFCVQAIPPAAKWLKDWSGILEGKSLKVFPQELIQRVFTQKRFR